MEGGETEGGPRLCACVSVIAAAAAGERARVWGGAAAAGHAPEEEVVGVGREAAALE